MQTEQGGPGDCHSQPQIGGLESVFHTSVMLQGGEGMDVEDVEGQEAHYRKGGLHYRLRLTIFLQRQHQGSKSIHIPPDDPV